MRAALALLLLAGPALAHGLSVFASVRDGTVIVEGKTGGDPVTTGEVILRGPDGADLARVPVDPDGTTEIPAAGLEAGVEIELRLDADHADYWVLTPEDFR